MPGDRRRLDGVMLGIARAVNAYWKVGGYFGAQRSRLGRDEDTAQADIDSTHLGLHLAGHAAGLRLVLGAARSWHRIESSRVLQAGKLRDALGARYRGHTSQVFGEAAWPLFERELQAGSLMEPALHSAAYSAQRGQVDMTVGVTPFARLAWVRTNLDGFAEQGGAAALSVRPASMAAWVSTLGLRAEATVGAPSRVGGSEAGNGHGSDHGTAKVYAQVAWHHADINGAMSTQSFRDSATQRLFTSQGLAPVRNSWSLRLGMDARIGKRTNVGFAYRGRYGHGLRDQGIGGWARIVF